MRSEGILDENLADRYSIFINVANNDIDIAELPSHLGISRGKSGFLFRFQKDNHEMDLRFETGSLSAATDSDFFFCQLPPMMVSTTDRIIADVVTAEITAAV